MQLIAVLFSDAMQAIKAMQAIEYRSPDSPWVIKKFPHSKILLTFKKSLNIRMCLKNKNKMYRKKSKLQASLQIKLPNKYISRHNMPAKIFSVFYL